MRPTVSRTVKKFLETTSIHGIKYLCSPFHSDRVGWMVCCVASTCCASILFTVLWSRFLDAPTQLALLDFRKDANIRVPMVAVCPTPIRLAHLFKRKMSIEELSHIQLWSLLFFLLRRLPLSPIKIVYLEKLLSAHNMTIAEMMLHVMEPCESLLRVCRWRDRTVPCDRIFHKQITYWGACCVVSAAVLYNATTADVFSPINPKLDLLVQCAETTNYEFFTKYSGEEFVSPIVATTGYGYTAHLKFTATVKSSKDMLVDGGCVSDYSYSRRLCFIRCKERECGCSDPLASGHHDDANLPLCSISQMNCIRYFELISHELCNCPLYCRQVSINRFVESYRFNKLVHTLDPIFDQANASSIVISIKLFNSNSKTFELTYTETWLSLLSSLGGVFNLFLGVGLFTALELVFLLTSRLPSIFRPRRRR